MIMTFESIGSFTIGKWACLLLYNADFKDLQIKI